MISLSPSTLALLEDIENRIDPAVEDEFLQQWHDFVDHRFTGDIFRAGRKKTSPAGVPYQRPFINDALDSYEVMLVSQLEGVSRALESEDQLMAVRSNYGTGIMTSLFGAEIFYVPREMNTLPTTRSFNDTDRIRRITESGMPDLSGGFGKRVFEMGEIYREVFAHYPKIEKYVDIFQPDTQGPLDICELLWGCDMFYALYDEPELVHSLMTLVCDTYTAFMKKWYALAPRKSKYNVHISKVMFEGGILLRDDSAMNLSPALYDEYAAPYDGLLLERFGGGAVHFCGRGDHYIEMMSKIPGLNAINMSQPHLNDMEAIYRATVDRGIQIVGFNAKRASEDVSRPGGFGHNLSI